MLLLVIIPKTKLFIQTHRETNYVEQMIFYRLTSPKTSKKKKVWIAFCACYNFIVQDCFRHGCINLYNIHPIPKTVLTN